MRVSKQYSFQIKAIFNIQLRLRFKKKWNVACLLNLSCFFSIKEINFGLNLVWKFLLRLAKMEECVVEKWIGTDTHLMQMQAEESWVCL